MSFIGRQKAREETNNARADLGARGRSCAPRLTVAVFAGVLGLMAFAPSFASAAYTRPLLCQISTVSNPSGVAIDGEDNAWVEEALGSGGSETGPENLYEFDPAYSSCGAFLGPKPGPAPLEIVGKDNAQHLAIETATGHFYVTGRERPSQPSRIEVFDGEGKAYGGWENEHIFGSRNAGSPPVAVDDSTDSLSDPSACGTPPLGLSECFVYVAHENPNEEAPEGDGLPPGVEKFNAKGGAVNFSGCATCASYVQGNEITGTPQGGFESGVGVNAVAIDPEGDIFVVGNASKAEVFEYRPSGEFVRAFKGMEAPRIGGMGGFLTGMTFDAASGHLLISAITSSEPTQGAIDEFDVRTGRFLSQITSGAGGAGLQQPNDLAADSSGDVYAVDTTRHVVEVFGPGRFLPSDKLGEATGRSAQGAVVLNGQVNPESTVNPEGLGLSECKFEYVTEAAFNHNVEAHGGQEAEGFADLSSGGSAPCAGEVPADSNWHGVHADLSGLVSGSTYRYRLVAATGGALGGSSATGAFAFTVPHAPAVLSSSADGVSSEFADLRASVDPLGSSTVYHFEYDTAPYAGSERHGLRAPVGDAPLGAGGPTGSSPESVLQHVSGLAPGTTYHFRVVAENAAGTEYGPDETFTTLPEARVGLPDGRAYELVTPANKQGGGDMFAEPETNGEFSNQHDTGTPSDSGNSFIVETDAAFGSFPAAGQSAYVFSRTPSGWTYLSLADPSRGVQNVEAEVFDPADLSRVGLTDGVGVAAGESGEQQQSLLGPPGGPYETLHADTPHYYFESSLAGTRIVGSSADLGDVVLQGEGHSLCPGAEAQDPGSYVLCEWSGGSGLSLVNTDPEGGSISRCGAVLGGMEKEGGDAGSTRNAVSADGSRIFFTAPDPHLRLNTSSAKTAEETRGCWNGAAKNAPQLYMRTGGETVEVSSPEAEVSDPTGQHGVAFVGASEDGSRVFFLSETWLTADHPTGHDMELYEYDTVTGAVKRISVGEPGGKAGAGVLTVPAVSADGSAVYFTAFAALAPGASPRTQAEKLVNVYRYDTASATVSYVATVNTYDYPFGRQSCFSALGVTGLCSDANWYTTPDGRFLLFGTSRELTGNSTTGSCNTLSQAGGGAGGVGNGHCDELYRYDSATGKVVCVSCDPSGEAAVSNAVFGRSASLAADAAPVRAMSDDGSYVFFDSADPLVPRAKNHTLNVYEWEAAGTGACTRENGCVSLLSSGEDAAPSFFLGATPSGHDVFIGTHAKLVPQDTDANGDIYDVRICEPERDDPCIKPAAGRTGQCEGSACQSVPPTPLDATPTSLSFSGPGNAQPPVASPALRHRALTRAQKFARALKACKRTAKRRRGACEAQARRRYGAGGTKARRPRARRSNSNGRGGR